MAHVLVTGATGYVGGRLVPALLDDGHTITCLARTPAKLTAAPWHSRVAILAGDVGHVSADELRGVDVAVYLVHGIGQGPNWAENEKRDASHFGSACADAGVRAIVYLGGLGDETSALSEHLASRHEVGRLLGSHGVSVTELRAGVIVGSGSASFEMLRYLVEVLPVMVTPRWIDTRCQPIGIADVVTELRRAIANPQSGTFGIGGPDVVSYADMMESYARVAGLPRRRFFRVPFLTPGLSSHWIGLVTPVPVPLARELVESLVNEVIVPAGSESPYRAEQPLGLDEAIGRALAATNEGRVPTSFTNADLADFRPSPTDPEWSGGTLRRDVRTRTTALSTAAVYDAVTSLGGETGWLSGEWLWRIRGLIDQLIGGPGLRRGRPPVLRIGDPLDFWRVEEIIPGTTLALYAEMRLPGQARLRWDIARDGDVTTITQTALFRPRGLLGRLYWWSVAPFHRFVFPGLLEGILRLAAQRSS